MTITLNNGKKITADKETLNEIALAFINASGKFKADGAVYLSESAKENFDIIFDSLDATGFYG